MEPSVPLLRQMGETSRALTRIEADFSAALGEGSRWMEHVVITLLFLAVLTVETIGLTLTFRTTRALSREIGHVVQAAEELRKI